MGEGGALAGGMMIGVDLSITRSWADESEWQAVCERAVAAAFSAASLSFTAAHIISVSIALSSDDEVQTLNAQWRGKDKPTNVLSFPMLEADELSAIQNDSAASGGEILLGDIILAHETCAAEAREKTIPLPQHAAHLIVHGTLHLLGYDHIEEAEADAMEAIEVKALASLGLPNPYM